MQRLKAESVEAVVCDPPYDLPGGFMSLSWDQKGAAFDPKTWEATLRVLTPGGYLLAFGGPRTFHRLASAIEDAGFEIRDCIMWLYGSGFPKSMNVGKAISKADPPATVEATKWDGWGTALKPAWESILLAVKPLDPPTEWRYILASLRQLGARLCLLFDDAVLAEEVSASSPSVPELLVTARWTAAERTSTRAALSEGTGTSRFVKAVRTSLSTVLSWSVSLAAACEQTSMFTTGTASSLTTAPRILRFCLSEITPESIVRAEITKRGSMLHASPAVAYFHAAVLNIDSTRVLSALGPATESALGRCPDADAPVLRPNWRPIILARKPLIGTVAKNVLEHGTGALHIDQCRIPHVTVGSGNLAENPHLRTSIKGGKNTAPSSFKMANGEDKTIIPHSAGRWPANMVLDSEAGALLDMQTGTRTSGKVRRDGKHTRNTDKFRTTYGAFPGQRVEENAPIYGDSGGASRFFYCPKASAKERWGWCRGCRVVLQRTKKTVAEHKDHEIVWHPTQKPLDLMQWLVRLVTPPGGTVLDPFAGSGTTGVASALEGLDFVGVEQDRAYLRIAVARLGDAGVRLIEKRRAK